MYEMDTGFTTSIMYRCMYCTILCKSYRWCMATPVDHHLYVLNYGYTALRAFPMLFSVRMDTKQLGKL